MLCNVIWNVMYWNARNAVTCNVASDIWPPVLPLASVFAPPSYSCNTNVGQNTEIKNTKYRNTYNIQMYTYTNHCTMGLSIEIEDFQVLKSKCLVFAQFWSKSDNSFFDWCKTVNILVEKYFPHKYDDKYGIFFTKNLKGWTVKPEILHEDTRGQL